MQLYLWWEGQGGESIFVGDLKAIGEGGEGSLGPAGAAVLGDVLVHSPGQVVPPCLQGHPQNDTLCHVAKILYEYKQQNSIVVYVPMFREAKEDISGNDEIYTIIHWARFGKLWMACGNIFE
jgi:hypothetical protein